MKRKVGKEYIINFYKWMPLIVLLSLAKIVYEFPIEIVFTIN